MPTDLRHVVAIMASLWRADFTRSVTRSERGTRAVLVALAIMAALWLGVAVSLSSPGDVRVPTSIQFQVFEQVVAGVALASACSACILIVVLPRPRELDTLMASIPISRTARSLAPVVPVLMFATLAGPVVFAALVVAAVRLVDEPLRAALLCATCVAAIAGAALSIALVRSLERLLLAAKLDETTALTLSASTALAGGVAGFAVAGQSAWTTSLAADPSRRAVAAAAIVALVAAGALICVLVTTRLRPTASRPPVVRWLGSEKLGRAATAPVVIDTLIVMRSPQVVSSLVLAAVVAVITALARFSGAPFAPLLGVTLVVGVPATIALTVYGTDRVASWRRATSIPREADSWGWIRVGETLALAMVAGIVCAAVSAPPEPTLLGPSYWLAVTGAVLAGILLPGDMELPGVGVAAAVLALVLAGLPLWLSSHVAEGSWSTVVAIVVGTGYSVTAPVVIRRRRRASIAA